jgi:hypothetical protein
VSRVTHTRGSLDGGAVPTDVRVSWRLGNGSETCRPFDRFDVDLVGSMLPWRRFRWHKGQTHYSGSYWSSTMAEHVVYESRLELARLLFADFDRSVSAIFAQPFLIAATVGDKNRKHVPDFLLVTESGPLVVDVKPRARLTRPDVHATLTWTRQVVESRGWLYEVWTEPPEIELANVRFLSGYRRVWLFRQETLDRLSASYIDGLTIDQVLALHDEVAGAVVRGCLLHLLWRQMYTTDLTRPLDSRHVLRRTP